MTGEYEVRNPEAEKSLREIGGLIKGQLPPNMGFTLFLFDYGEKGSTFYMSSANRADMLKLLWEFIGKQENKL
jgi:hypothetical protein